MACLSRMSSLLLQYLLLLLVSSSPSSSKVKGRSSSYFATAFSIEGSLRRPSQTTHSVTPSRRPRILSRLNVIEPEVVAIDFDVRQGGVQLAEESVIKIEGNLMAATARMEPTLTNVIRYTRMVAVDEALVTKALTRLGATIVAIGSGRELYQDPGTSTVQTIRYGPVEAVRNAVQQSPMHPLERMTSSTTTVRESKPTTLVVNFCGGTDAQVLEVLDALRDLTSSAPDNNNNNKAFQSITFHSISHETFSSGSSDVLLIAMPTTSGAQSTADVNAAAATAMSEEDGVFHSIANGDLYCSSGQYYTLMERDINPAIA